MTNSYDFEGTPVSEEEAAASLGFSSVPEFRRWRTEQGQRVWELEVKLREAELDRDEFRWHVRRMTAVLGRVEPTLTDPLLRLVVGVVLGRDVDWKHQLKDWWEKSDVG
jgi:hypothetical protein